MGSRDFFEMRAGRDLVKSRPVKPNLTKPNNKTVSVADATANDEERGDTSSYTL